MTIERQTRYPLRFGRMMIAATIAAVALLTTAVAVTALFGTIEPSEASCTANGGNYDTATGVCTLYEHQDMWWVTVITGTILDLAGGAYIEYEIIGPGPQYVTRALVNYGTISATADFEAYGGAVENMGTFFSSAPLTIAHTAVICYPSSYVGGGGYVCVTVPGFLYNSGHFEVAGTAHFSGTLANWGTSLNRGELTAYGDGDIQNYGYFTNTGALDIYRGELWSEGQFVNQGLLQNRRNTRIVGGHFLNQGVFENQEKLENHAVISNTGTLTSSGLFFNTGVVSSTTPISNSGDIVNYGVIDAPLYNSGCIFNAGRIMQKITGPGIVIDMPYQARFPFIAQR